MIIWLCENACIYALGVQRVKTESVATAIYRSVTSKFVSLYLAKYSCCIDKWIKCALFYDICTDHNLFMACVLLVYVNPLTHFLYFKLEEISHVPRPKYNQ